MLDLIYFTIGNHIRYYDMWDICFRSLMKYGKYKGDYRLLLSDTLPLDTKMSIPTEKVRKLPCKNIMDSATNKLMIFNQEDIHKYDRVLYLDCDMIVINDIYKILDMIGNDFLVRETTVTMCESFLGGDILDKKEKAFVKKNNILGVNSGIFGFKPTLANLNVLKFAYETTKKSPPNACLEQPSFNYAILKTNKCDRKLKNFVFNNNNSSLYEKNISKQEIQNHIKNGVVVLHFCGGPGNYKDKYGQMRLVSQMI